MNLRSSLAFLPLVLSSCITSQGYNPMANQSQVQLREGNFTISQTGARGEASCPYLFGFIPLGKPSVATRAMDDLVDTTDSGGQSHALVNVAMDRRKLNFLLFTVHTVKLRADVAKFRSRP